MTARVRRARYLFLTVADAPALDLAAFLRGTVTMGTEPQIVALSVLRGEPFPLDDKDAELLFAVGAESWTDAGAHDQTRVARLVHRGLLLADPATGEAAELRAREERITTANWHPYTALLHSLTRWRGVRQQPVELDAGAAKTAADAIVQRWGPPPAALHRRAGGNVVDLPLDDVGEFEGMLSRRRTTRAFDRSRELSLHDLAALLRWTFGAHAYAWMHETIVGIGKTSPSGGGLHPVEAYPLLLRVAGVEPGVYHYDAGRHALVELRRLGVPQAEELVVEFGAGQPWLRDAAAVILLTARFERTYWKYRGNNRAFAVVLMDAAHMSQTFQLLATRRGVGAMVTAAINAAEVDEELGIDGFTEGSLVMLACGPAAARPHPLQPDFQPYVPRETDLGA
jgi:putative peptide maturation dehydrogenase